MKGYKTFIRTWGLRRCLPAAGAVLLTAALCLALHLTGAYAVYTGGTVRRLPVYSVEREEKLLAITFDCAWGTDHTDAILEALSREGVRATFFMVQFWAERYPEFVRKIDEAGHEIGTHSATHSHMTKLSKEEVRAELSSSSAAITAVTGKKVDLFRPPFGDYNDALVSCAEEEGYAVIQWDVDSLDWKDLSAQDIAMRVLSRARQGSIILCHNNALHTAEALPVILSTLKNSGYTFVPVGELIWRGGSVDASGRQQPPHGAGQ